MSQYFDFLLFIFKNVHINAHISGWDETNFLGKDREIRPTIQDREKVDADFLNEMRPRKECMIFICKRQDRDET